MGQVLPRRSMDRVVALGGGVSVEVGMCGGVMGVVAVAGPGQSS